MSLCREPGDSLFWHSKNKVTSEQYLALLMSPNFLCPLGLDHKCVIIIPVAAMSVMRSVDNSDPYLEAVRRNEQFCRCLKAVSE